jgi:hypothetical protein
MLLVGVIELVGHFAALFGCGEHGCGPSAETEHLLVVC